MMFEVCNLLQIFGNLQETLFISFSNTNNKPRTINLLEIPYVAYVLQYNYFSVQRPCPHEHGYF